MMKNLILCCSLLLSLNSFADYDYHCQFRRYAIDLHMTNDRSTGMIIRETWRRETLYNGYVGSIQRNGGTTDFVFYGQDGEIILTFRTSDIERGVNQLTARIEAELEGFYMVDRLQCRQ
jgi:hypothetical protein